MSPRGTTAHRRTDVSLPPLVERAVELGEQLGFELSCLPETGRLLAVLAGGLDAGAVIGEAGTGCGVGLAWMASGARPGVRLVSIELDPTRAAAARRLFADVGAVTVLEGDATELPAHGPFDLLVLDGGPLAGKRGAGDPVDPTTVLAPAGVVVIDDLYPMAAWPPMTFEGEVDEARRWWLTHPVLFATEVDVAPGWSVVVARRRPPGAVHG